MTDNCLNCFYFDECFPLDTYDFEVACNTVCGFHERNENE